MKIPLYLILFLSFGLTSISNVVHAQNTFKKIGNEDFIIDSGYNSGLVSKLEFLLTSQKPNSVSNIYNSLMSKEYDNNKNFKNIPPQSTITYTTENLYQNIKNKVYLVGIYLRTDVQSRNAEIIASAYCISEDGVFITNYHVLKPIIEAQKSKQKNDSLYYFIESYNGDLCFIDHIIKFDSTNDISIFKINTNGKKYSAIPLGQNAKVGASIFCVSNPEGNYYYFSQGNVVRNYIKSVNKQYKYIMGISAEYAGGSSGSPIVDKYGNLVGMVSSTTSIFSGYNGHGPLQMILKNAVPLYPIQLLLSND